MIKFGKKDVKLITLQAIFDKEKIAQTIIKENNAVSINYESNEAFIYLGKKKDLTIMSLEAIMPIIIANNKKGFNIELDSFTNEKVSIEAATKLFADKLFFLSAKI
jgi:leucyl aminopeptidase